MREGKRVGTRPLGGAVHRVWKEVLLKISRGGTLLSSCREDSNEEFESGDG